MFDVGIRIDSDQIRLVIRTVTAGAVTISQGAIEWAEMETVMKKMEEG